MSTWSVNIRRALSGHYRDASVYGHTTTGMHDMSTPRTFVLLVYGLKHLAPSLRTVFPDTDARQVAVQTSVTPCQYRA